MNNDHFAILIGLSRYAAFEQPPADLQGPGSDVDAVKAWLTTAGAVPPANIRKIISRDPPWPTRDNLEDEAFMWVEGLALKNKQAGHGRTVGRRLYLYVSGHGFSPEIRQGCLLAGNANASRITANIGVSLWLQWWQDAGYFREYVLWMDCCMNRVMLATPSPPPLTAVTVPNSPGPTFIAFAAQRPLKAVEMPILEDQGRFHGVFTWNLLQGLKGAAADSSGIVTARGMANWLRNSILPWLSEGDRRDPDVAKEPDIVTEDEALILARGVAPLAFDVTLRFPPALAGRNALLWSGIPPKPVPLVIAAGDTNCQLTAGPYVVEVPGSPYRQGFSVVRSCSVTVNDTGTPVAAPPAGTIFALGVDPSDSTADIRIVAADFRIVDTGLGKLSASLPFGLYNVKLKIGRQIVERVVLLDASGSLPILQSDQVPQPQALSLPEITSAAPLPQTATTHEYQREALDGSTPEAAKVDLRIGDGAELMIMARVWSEPGNDASFKEPWAGVQVVAADGAVLSDLSRDGRRFVAPDRDPFALCAIRLAPGSYFLRYPSEAGRPLEQSLIVPFGGWRLEAYILHQLRSSNVDGQPRLSLMMRRTGAAWGAQEDLQLEKARVALADGRMILNEELEGLLVKKFENPLAGIMGGHFLLMDQIASGARVALLNDVVTNLRGLVGFDHPDVEALSLKCPDERLRSTLPVQSPPIFERSWRLIVEQSQVNPKLVPASLWSRVHALATLSPFLAWSPDPELQKDYRAALAEVVFGRKAPASETSRAAADVAASALELSFEAPGDDRLAGKPVRSGQKKKKKGPSGKVMRSEQTTKNITSRKAPEISSWSASLRLPPAALEVLRKEWVKSKK